MSRARTYIFSIYLIVGCFITTSVAGQASSEQKALEAKKQRIQKEITEINRLLFAEKKEKGNILEQMDALDQKINVLQELIRVTNQQSNLLNRQINANVRNIGKLRDDLKFLKEDYANLVQKSYQNKNQGSRLMFLLSSESFYQAYKRLQYIKQYAQHRKKQGEEIVSKTEVLSQLNKNLSQQRKDKDVLLAENRKIKNGLFVDIDTQKDLLKSIRKNENTYSKAIAAKKKEARAIDREIENLIRTAIANSNRKSGSAKVSAFVLTPEAKLVADNFEANKGRLIWPVERGIKSQGYGKYKDKVYPGIVHQNNGVTIATDKGAQARAVFDGEVIRVQASKSGVKGVFLRHGNYISVYYNLAEVYVKTGDNVSTKSVLGSIYTNRFDGATKLKFYMNRDSERLNPEEWINQL